MGQYNSAQANDHSKFEDQFDPESYTSKDLRSADVIKIREAFEALAERQPNGELGVRVSTLKNINHSKIEQSVNRVRNSFADPEKAMAGHNMDPFNAQSRRDIGYKINSENTAYRGDMMCQ